MKPKYFRTDTSVKTIDILTKEWVEVLKTSLVFASRFNTDLVHNRATKHLKSLSAWGLYRAIALETFTLKRS